MGWGSHKLLLILILAIVVLLSANFMRSPNGQNTLSFLSSNDINATTSTTTTSITLNSTILNTSTSTSSFISSINATTSLNTTSSPTTSSIITTTTNTTSSTTSEQTTSINTTTIPSPPTQGTVSILSNTTGINLTNTSTLSKGAPIKFFNGTIELVNVTTTYQAPNVGNIHSYATSNWTATTFIQLNSTFVQPIFLNNSFFKALNINPSKVQVYEYVTELEPVNITVDNTVPVFLNYTCQPIAGNTVVLSFTGSNFTCYNNRARFTASYISSNVVPPLGNSILTNTAYNLTYSRNVTTMNITQELENVSFWQPLNGNITIIAQGTNKFKIVGQGIPSKTYDWEYLLTTANATSYQNENLSLNGTNQSNYTLSRRHHSMGTNQSNNNFTEIQNLPITSINIDPTWIIPSNVNYIVNISLDNAQTAAIAAGVPVFIGVNMINYTQYASGSNHNWELFNGLTGNILYQWDIGNIANQLQASSTNTTSNWGIWVVLPAQIAASTNAVNVISLGFLPMGSSSLNGNNVGLAPQLFCASSCLSSSYGQYDNGANVYTVEYQNFAGTSCPSGWSCSGSLYSINNGAQISSGTGSTSIVTTSDFGTGTMLDTLAKNLGTPPSDVNLELGYGISSRGSGGLIDLDGAGSSIGCSNNNNAATAFSPAPPNDKLTIFTVNFTPSTITCYYNYTNSLQISTASSSSDVVGISKNNPYTIGGFVQWFGIRNPTPNNVQPTAVFEPVQVTGGSVIPSLTASITPIIASNRKETFTATVYSSNSPYTYNYLVINSVTNAIIANMLVTNALTSNTWIWHIPANLTGNTVKANVIVTNSNTIPVVANSLYTPIISIAFSPSPGSHIINISLSNQQTSQINAGTTILLPFNGLNYSQYFNGNTINLEIFNSITGNILYTWFGGNYLNPSQVAGFNTVANILLEFTLPSKIAASTNAVNVISIDLISMSSTALNGNNVGLAPQIYCASGCPATTYGEYDNGANVYTVEYQNFEGSSCPTGWSCSGSLYSVSNGVQISSGTGSTSVVTTASDFGTGTILDTLAKNLGTPPSDVNLELGYGISSRGSGGEIDLDGAGSSSIGCSNNNYATTFSTAPPNDQMMIFTVNFTPATITCTYNYTHSVQMSTVSSSADVVGISKNNPYTIGGYVQWLGIRMPPPNNIQPTMVSGPLQEVTGPIPTLTASNTITVAPGGYELFTANIIGETSPYTYNYQVINTVTGITIANMLVTNSYTSNTWLWNVPSNDVGNTIEANIIITDSFPVTINSLYTSAITIQNNLPLYYFVNVSLYNHQSSAISAGTAIMLPFNALNYTSYFNGNTINLEVVNSITGNVLYTWFGGNYLNPSQVTGFNSVSNILLEFTLPAQIAADTNAINVVSIRFLNFSSTTLNGNNVGLSPQIFCSSGCPATTYGEYDNGGNVYTTEYQNFEGSSCPSGWSCSGSLYSIDNGVKISGGTGSTSIVTISNFGPGTILDTLAKNLGSTSVDDANLELGYGISSDSSGGQIDLDGAGSAIGCSNSDVASTFSPAPPNNNLMIFTVNFTLATITCYYNYTISIQKSTYSDSADVVGFSKNNPYSVGGYVQWLGIRTPPPNGIQPTAVFGPLMGGVLATPTIFPNSATFLYANQILNVSAYEIGGTQPYTYNFIIFNASTNTILANQLGTSSTFLATTNTLWITNSPIVANVTVTDSETPNVIANSINTPDIRIVPDLNLSNSSEEVRLLTNYTYWQDLGYNTINLTALYETNITTNASNPEGGVWYGYTAQSGSGVVLSNTVKDVYASWIVPNVNSSLIHKKSSQWVGIGGNPGLDHSLIQVGTSSDAPGNDRDGNYSAWFELIPSTQFPIGVLCVTPLSTCNSILEPVRPGDIIEAYIIFGGNLTGIWKFGALDFNNLPAQTWVIFIRDVNQSWIAAGYVPYQSNETTADFISEDSQTCNDLNINSCTTAPYANYSISKFGNDFVQNTTSVYDEFYTGVIPGALMATIVNTTTGDWVTKPFGKFVTEEISTNGLRTIDKITPDNSSFGVTGSELRVNIKMLNQTNPVESGNIVHLTTNISGYTSLNNLTYNWSIANNTFGLTPIKTHDHYISGNYFTANNLTIPVYGNTIFAVFVTDNGVTEKPITYDYTIVNVTCGTHTPTNLVACIPILLNNTQLETISANTQIPIYFNASYQSWATYNYFSANVDNICFYDSVNGNCMPAWLEGNFTSPYSIKGNFNTANVPMLYWVKTDNSIPNGVSNNIYIGIFHKDIDNYEIGLNGILGANPTFNCSVGCPSKYYGGADNGANVFDLYDNFEGNYVSNTAYGNIDNNTYAQDASWTVENGLSISGSCSGCTADLYISGGKYAFLNSTENLAFEASISPFYGSIFGIPPYDYTFCYAPSGEMGFYSFNSVSNTVNDIDMGALVDTATGCVGSPPPYTPQQDYLYSNNGIVVVSRPIYSNPEPSLPYTLTLQDQHIFVQNLYSNNVIYGNSTSQYSGFTNDDVFAILDGPVSSGYGDFSHTDKIQWIRIRTPPPNDIFPTANEIN